MAAISVRPLGQAATDWMQGAGSRAAKYKANAAAAGGTFEANAIAAGPNYGAAVMSGNIIQRFIGGLRKAGSSAYTAGINAKGDRFVGGVNAAGDKWQSGYAPYGQALQGFDPGPRGPRGDPGNYARVQAVGDKQHQLKLQSLAAGR